MKFDPASAAFLAIAAAIALPNDVSASDGTPQVDAGALQAAVACNQKREPLKFLLLENEAVNAAIEDDIRQDLARIGFSVEAESLSKASINVARQAGDFHFSITETWGAPYDPTSFASGWIDGKGGEGVFPAMANFEEPASREELLMKVKRVMKEDDPVALSSKWSEIHNYYHAQAVMLPLYGKRIPTLLNTRLTNYQAGFQQFDYPVHKLVPLSGSSTITISPGSRTGLFKTVGHLDAHTYGPNEFFSSNWVYEGLVTYGQGGQILPSLATSWTIEENNMGGDAFTFTLREDVRFHDGTPWDCAAAKMNFDHLFAGELGSTKHGWYGVGEYTDNWYCNGDMEFVINTSQKHGPYLQELALIRPARFISPAAFVDGGADPIKANSCQLAWGVIDGTEVSEDVVCAGITGIYGTGPFAFESKDTVIDGAGDTYDNEVVFSVNEDYWGGVPGFERLVIKRYETSEDVQAALLNGELDVVWGSGVLSDSAIFDIENDVKLQKDIRVFHSDDIQNVILLLNSGLPPLDDINVRKTIIHSINKSAFVQKELKGLQSVVDNVFPREAPYCDLDLTPRWDYDFEKAILLSCSDSKALSTGQQIRGSSAENNETLALGLGLGLGFLVLFMAVIAIFFYKRVKTLEVKLDKKANAEFS